jgi:hypothetical protein
MNQNQTQKTGKLTGDDVSNCKQVTLYFRKKSARDDLILTWAKRRGMSMSDAIKDLLLAQVVSEIKEFANEIHGESPTVLKYSTASQFLSMVNEWDEPASKKITTKPVALPVQVKPVKMVAASDKQTEEKDRTNVKTTRKQHQPDKQHQPEHSNIGDEQPF